MVQGMINGYHKIIVDLFNVMVIQFLIHIITFIEQISINDHHNQATENVFSKTFMPT